MPYRLMTIKQLPKCLFIHFVIMRAPQVQLP